jgi:hypothetical protein
LLRSRHLRTRAQRASRVRAGLSASLSLLALVGACVAPASALASAHGPRYTLKVAEGETTLPEYEHPDWVSAGIENSKTEVVLEIIHGGLVAGQSSGKNGEGAWVSPGPQVGDEVVFESPRGTTIARFAYDGLPSLDPTVCAGSTNFSGQNSSGDVVEGFYVKNVLETPYHQSTKPVQKAFGEAQVKSLSGTTFGGDFLKPLELGEDVGAIESLKTALAGEATYTYTSENERPVGACPAPPPPYAPPPPPPPVLQGSILKLVHVTIQKLLKSGWLTTVSINQPGSVTEDLYAEGGRLPAYASSVSKGRKHHKLPPALLLARGTSSAGAAGTVDVLLRATSKGRSKLKHDKRVKAVLITTLHSASGATLTLSRRTVTLSV